ncbi:hypothetical protein N864_14250 [Intrasporangium chromatireducens Q5-1]|uniref:Uncharacterized protein n=1 Tax=Intrasporangium chromatireducens Q5-1 TaxID=584657 RepID=W9GGL8_9MICO|nr:hypothetical protein [Intrasporangium chromatireducens]EWT04337.1 hypothetical protein N864_14250 [Intrasporangium chromatireducens Q5-1]
MWGETGGTQASSGEGAQRPAARSRARRIRSAILVLGVVLTLVVGLGACTSEPRVDLEESVGRAATMPPVAPTQVVIVTETRTGTLMPTVTVTVTPTAMVAPTATALPTTPTIPAVFDEAAARRAVQAVLTDVTRLDKELRATTPTATATLPGRSGRTSSPSGSTPPTVGTATVATSASAGAGLRALDGHLRDLLSAGVPTGTDGPSYVARILSLQVFVSAALGETATNPSRAAARYSVIRAEVGVLLGQVGTGLGATFTLPPAAPAR